MSLPRPLWRIPAVFLVFVAAEFAALTELALSATAQGRTAFAVGLLSAALWLGILAASLGAYRLIQRWGHARVFVSACGVAVPAVLSFALHGEFLLWGVGILVLGLGGGVAWVTGEAWLATAVPRHQRGWLIGIFEAAIGLGLMLGPAFVPLARGLGASPLWLAAALMAAAWLLSLGVLRARNPPTSAAPDDSEGALGNADDWRLVIAPLVGLSMLGGAMEGGISALLPSISMRVGFAFASAALLGAVIGAGSTLFQPLVGWAADRLGLHGVMRLVWWAVLLTSTGLAWFASAHPLLLYLAGFALAGLGGAAYTLAVVELGHRLAGADLVRAVAVLIVAYAVGTSVAPPLGGWLFDRSGLGGFFWAVAALALLGLALTWRARAGLCKAGRKAHEDGRPSPSGNKA